MLHVCEIAPSEYIPSLLYSAIHERRLVFEKVTSWDTSADPPTERQYVTGEGRSFLNCVTQYDDSDIYSCDGRSNKNKGTCRMVRFQCQWFVGEGEVLLLHYCCIPPFVLVVLEGSWGLISRFSKRHVLAGPGSLPMPVDAVYAPLVWDFTSTKCCAGDLPFDNMFGPLGVRLVSRHFNLKGHPHQLHVEQADGTAYNRAAPPLPKIGISPQDLIDSTFGNMGWDDSESYGLTWKVRGLCKDLSNLEIFDKYSVYGDILNSDIYGAYRPF